MTSRMIPLDQLRFGHEADPPINARRVGRDDDVSDLAASIGAHGLITPLKVKEIDGVSYVGIGNRRLKAMRLLVEQNQYKPDLPIECVDFDEMDGDVREIALAEQIMRAPLHEADQYEEFTALSDAGMSEASIASRFGIEAKRVKRILALGRLSPVILDWWRSEEPSNNVIEAVRAFTLAPSVEEQERVFRKLSGTGGLWSHAIRREFGAGDREIGRLLEFVGVKAYTAAGGSVTEDLFGEDHAVSDPALVTRLVAEKLQAKVDEALKDGWSWAALADDLPSSWSWNWQKLPINKKATKADKAKSGVVVNLDYQYKLRVTYGVVRPEERKAEKGEKKEKGAPTISNAMMHRLSIQVTDVTKKALSEEPRIGLVALLAGIMSWSDGPLKASVSGIGRGGREPEHFGVVFQRLASMSDADLFKVAAGLAGEALDMQSQNALAMPLAKGGDVLAAAIDPDRMAAALRETFDAADYFGGVAKPFVIQAIREAVNEDEARKAEKLKKKELVEFAVKNVQPTGWLPPELRCATYSGPGAAPERAATGSPPADVADADFENAEDLEDEAA